VDVVGTLRHSFTRADAAVAERPPPRRRPCPEAPPPGGELLRPLFGGEEVRGRPEEFQQGPVAPVGPTALRPAAAGLGPRGEAAVAPAVGEEEEEVRVGLEELEGHRGVGVAADRVVAGAHAQHGDRHLVRVPQRLVAFPVTVPADGGVAVGARRRGGGHLTEQRLLQAAEGTAGEQGGRLDALTQHRLVPGTHTHSVTRTHTVTHTHTQNHTHTMSHTVSHTHTHRVTHTQCHTQCHTHVHTVTAHTQCHTHKITRTQCHTHTQKNTVSHAVTAHSVTHTQNHTHRVTNSHRTHTVSHSVTRTQCHTHTMSHTHSHTMSHTQNLTHTMSHTHT